MIIFILKINHSIFANTTVMSSDLPPSNLYPAFLASIPKGVTPFGLTDTLKALSAII